MLERPRRTDLDLNGPTLAPAPSDVTSTRGRRHRPARIRLTPVRVLVVTNFVPDAAAPQRGRWVRDQVDEVRRRGVEVDVFSFPRGRSEYLPATRRLRRAAAARALRPRPRPLRARRLVRAAGRGAAADRHLPRHRRPPPRRRPALAPARLARRPRRRASRGRCSSPRTAAPACPPVPGSAVLPCGPDLEPLRPAARGPRRGAQLGLDPDGRYLFFPANPARPGEAPRPRRRAGRAPAAPSCSPAARSSPSGCRSGSTPPTPSSSPPTTRASGWPRSRRWPARCPVLSTPVGIAPYALGGHRRLPLRPLRRRRLERRGAAPPGRRRTPASPAPRAPPRSRRRGWPSA